MPNRLRVLILEDEPLVSAMLADMVSDLGCDIAGVFLRVAHAAEFIERHSDRIDVAIVDINVAGERSIPVLQLLEKQGVKAILVSAYDTGLEAKWRKLPKVKKPFTIEELATTLERVSGVRLT